MSSDLNVEVNIMALGESIDAPNPEAWFPVRVSAANHDYVIGIYTLFSYSPNIGSILVTTTDGARYLYRLLPPNPPLATEELI